MQTNTDFLNELDGRWPGFNAEAMANPATRMLAGRYIEHASHPAFLQVLWALTCALWLKEHRPTQEDFEQGLRDAVSDNAVMLYRKELTLESVPAMSHEERINVDSFFCHIVYGTYEWVIRQPELREEYLKNGNLYDHARQLFVRNAERKGIEVPEWFSIIPPWEKE